jgi:predicted lipoprotein with Yx(FWY)xxD motif
MRRYLAGALCMGFGGMLAGGCAVGAGVSGAAIFALTAWLSLIGMWLGGSDQPPDRPARVCNGPCATNWPPLFAMDNDGSAGDYSVITRDDGKKQWAFKGKPLYFWSKDQKAGDTTGDGFNNVWHVAKP